MTRVIVPNWIVIQFQGHNWTLNYVSGSQFYVELRPGVIIQRGIKTRGHNSTGGPNFIRRRVVKQWPPVSGGRNSTWKNRWILITARWIKTPRVEIQRGQNSILHRRMTSDCKYCSMNIFALVRFLHDLYAQKADWPICAFPNRTNMLRRSHYICTCFFHIKI